MQSVSRYASVKGDGQSDADSQQKQAGYMAELIAKCVQVSIALSKDLDFKTSEADADAIRLSIATVSGPIIGEYFSANGKAPTDQDVTKMVGALQAALTFADKFAPTDSISRCCDRYFSRGYPMMKRKSISSICKLWYPL